MSHIHVPDGIIPIIWWSLGYLLTFTIMYLLLRKMNNEEARRKIPLTGICAAIMLIGMSVPLGIIPVHLSLAVLTGIIVGPGLGFIAVFVVNLIIALIGHGGITLVGLNTLIIGSEVLVGSYLYRKLSKRIKTVPSTLIATAIGVIISLSLMIGLVGTTVGWVEALPHHHANYHGDEIEEIEANQSNREDHNVEEHDHNHFVEALSDIHYLRMTGWIALILILIAGIGTEALGTALIVRFFSKVRPDLIYSSNSLPTDIT